MRSSPFVAVAAITFVFGATDVSAQEEEKGGVLIPSALELNEEQKADLRRVVEAELTDAVKTCVAGYPRPEFFTTVYAQYELKKSGRLNGGYIGGDAPDSNLYVASDEEREKLERAGSFTRLVVRSDKEVDRCLKKQTGKSDSGLSRYAAHIDGAFEVSWKGKVPKVTATKFDVEKK